MSGRGHWSARPIFCDETENETSWKMNKWTSIRTPKWGTYHVCTPCTPNGVQMGYKSVLATLLKITFWKPMTMCPGQDIHASWLGYQCHPKIKDMHCCQQGQPSKSKYSSHLHWIIIPTERDNKMHKKTWYLKQESMHEWICLQKSCPSGLCALHGT